MQRFFLGVCLLIISVLLVGSGAEAQPRTGLRLESRAEQQLLRKKFPTTRRVRMNTLALARLNAERRQQGKSEIAPETQKELAPIGEEAESTSRASAAAQTLPMAGAAVPAQVDNSLLAAFPGMHPSGQGAQGSCVAWATTNYQLTHETALARGWNSKLGGDVLRFSPKWTYNLANNGADAGLTFYGAYSVLEVSGAATAQEFPYDGNFLAWDLNPEHWRRAAAVRPTSRGTIYNQNAASLIDTFEQQLANGHVLVIGTYAYSWVNFLTKNDPATGADDLSVGQYVIGYQSGFSGAHAVTLVGYDRSIWTDLNGNNVVDAGEKGAFKVANSWGAGWANGGYIWLAYDAVFGSTQVSGFSPNNKKGVVMNNAGYWMASAVSYKPKLLAEFKLNTARRNQLVASLGIDSTVAAAPTTTTTFSSLAYNGGPYAFDGSTTAIDGTFVLDFTDLQPPSGVQRRYFLSIYDSTAGDPIRVLSYRLLDGDGNVLATAPAANLPQFPIDAGTSFAFIDYTFGTAPNQPPVAIGIADKIQGFAPLNVLFSGNASFDPDGTVVSHTWNFGDGTPTDNHQDMTHVFMAPGTYTVTLAVTDNAAATTTSPVAAVVVLPKPALLGDVNFDGKVDIFDINLISAHWGETKSGGGLPGDANGDGIVNIFDINEVSYQWQLASAR